MGDTALITGASSGIGLELAKIMAREAFDLILVARRADKLSELAQELTAKYSIKAHVIVADLALAGASAKLFHDTEQRGLKVDVLVNNAGYGHWGKFLDFDPVDDTAMLQLNMVALTELSRLYGQGMRTRKHGRILNVASTAAFQPGPLMATYFATKAYVLSLSEALANELKPDGVTVTALCPGPTISGFQDRAKMHESRMLKVALATSESVAELGFAAMMRGKTVAITGVMNYVLANSIRLVPRNFATRVSRFISDRPGA